MKKLMIIVAITMAPALAFAQNPEGARGGAAAGDEDRLVSPENSEQIAKALHCPLRVFKGCGHVPVLQEPMIYNQMLIEHFESSLHPVKVNV